ncbi:MAG TPA: glycine cleavage T C-terminal barrel domain-containing protein, partial [Tepidisphaeraceae bacterium]|nr:glycine cleavage T C-terminal barrel domain-containing protein [Tepidisphaeraceae bacterium]
HPMPSILHHLHAAAGAEFQPYADIEIVTTFGHPQAEYAAVRTAAAIIDLPQRGLIELTGKDRLPFLNNLVTNQTKLETNHGVYAFLLNTKGRITTDLNVLELGDRTLLELDRRMAEIVAKTLEKYVFTEDVKIQLRLSEMAEIALHGPTAPKILHEYIATDVSTMSPLACVQVNSTILWRDDVLGVPGYHLICPVSELENIWQSLLKTFASPDPVQAAKQRLRSIGWAVYNTTRIEAGRPFFGIDFDDTVLPAETGQMNRAVSLTKGCYLGQEIVARMHARNQVPRKIVGLRISEDALPIAGTAFPEGLITSSTVSPVLSNACIALALVKKPFYEIGTKLKVPAEGAMRDAIVLSLPFH